MCSNDFISEVNVKKYSLSHFYLRLSHFYLRFQCVENPFNTIEDHDPCYDAKLKRPQACVPDFVNAAYGVPVKASSTCLDNKSGHVCNEKANGPFFLTDLHNPNNVTCWKSDFVNEDTKENVTLTVSLKKKYELTYVSLHFCHAKPNSMAILKRDKY